MLDPGNGGGAGPGARPGGGSGGGRGGGAGSTPPCSGYDCYTPPADNSSRDNIQNDAPVVTPAEKEATSGFFPEVGGFFIGAFEGARDTVTGTVVAGGCVAKSPFGHGDGCVGDYWEGTKAVFDDPSLLFLDIEDEWEAGNQGQASGKAAFELVPISKLKILGKLKDACSFASGTEVLMADGTTKPINHIQVGDWVWAADPETGEAGPRQVTHLWIHNDTLIDLAINGTTITTTEDHPFWNHTDQQWQRADTLNPGDQLLTATSTTITVGGLLNNTERIDLAYNLTITDLHTYHVTAGDTPVLVHNDCPTGDFESRGSTGRTTPGGANERQAMELVTENPGYGERLSTEMKDPRWDADDGWVKMEQTVDGIEIHYVHNTRTGAYDDFKFKDWDE
jgi:hypothetical protein